MQKRVCSLPGENGRITLTGDTLKITEHGKVTERKLNTEEDVQEILWNYFGVKL
jgi:N-hydroxyarylamine O-acetyltransferase